MGSIFRHSRKGIPPNFSTKNWWKPLSLGNLVRPLLWNASAFWFKIGLNEPPFWFKIGLNELAFKILLAISIRISSKRFTMGSTRTIVSSSLRCNSIFLNCFYSPYVEVATINWWPLNNWFSRLTSRSLETGVCLFLADCCQSRKSANNLKRTFNFVLFKNLSIEL